MIIRSFVMKDFDTLSCPILTEKPFKGDFMKKNYPALTLIKSKHRKGITRYLFLMFDRGSPLLTIKDLKDRKDTALFYSGLIQGDVDNHGPVVESCIGLSDIVLIDAARSILSKHSNFLLRSYLVLSQMYSDLERQLLSPIKDINNDKQRYDAGLQKSKLADVFLDLARKIQELSLELFVYDEEDNMLKIIKHTPSSVAMKTVESVLSDEEVAKEVEPSEDDVPEIISDLGDEDEGFVGGDGAPGRAFIDIE